jgi:hypothetical protein
MGNDELLRIRRQQQARRNSSATAPRNPNAPGAPRISRNTAVRRLARGDQALVQQQPQQQRNPVTGNPFLASGVFQQMRYPILRDLPGGQPGTTNRFDLSFRDKSGYKKPTSHAYLNRVSPPSTGWRGLRLDYGFNVKTGTSNWHWNHKGGGGFGITNHALASPSARNFARTMKVLKPLGRGAVLLNAGLDGYSLANQINQSRQTGNWSNTRNEAASIAGGWGGAWAGAKAGGALGATIGSFGGPLGTVIGGAAGGIIGGGLGYWGGSSAGRFMSRLFD